MLYAEVIGWLRILFVTILASNTTLPLMKHREKGFTPCLQQVERNVVRDMCGCTFHGSYVCVGVKPDEYGNVVAPALGLLKYGVA